MSFVPFDATPDEVAAREVLRPGVPPSMRPALTSWIGTEIASTRSGVVDVGRFRELENALDIEFGINPEFGGHLSLELARKLLNKLTERELLRVVDYRLFVRGVYNTFVSELSDLLSAGRSMYEAVPRDSSYRLAERVPAGVQTAAEQIMGLDSSAGALLKRAWEAIYDFEPKDSSAYASAVKAVEAAALPALGIEKSTATVSDAVRAIEKKDSTWRLPFQREHTEYPSRDVLLGMLKSLYRGQRDRHGSAAYTEVTHEEAEAAVLMAVTLVGWFVGGLVRERDTTEFG